MNTKKPLLALILVILCGIALVLYAARASVTTTLNNLKLIPQPEHFTELYFDNPLTLPKSTVAKTPLSFSFTIHNVEGTSTVYPYVAYFEPSTGGEVLLANNAVSVADNETKSVAVSFTPSTSNEIGTVVVELTQLKQEIDFLLPNHT